MLASATHTPAAAGIEFIERGNRLRIWCAKSNGSARRPEPPGTASQIGSTYILSLTKPCYAVRPRSLTPPSEKFS
jgi:hypothetical protein